MGYGAVGGVSFRDYVKLAGTGMSHAELAHRAATGQPGDHGREKAAAMGIEPLAWERAMLVWGSRCAIDPQLSKQLARKLATRAVSFPLSVLVGFGTRKLQIPPRPPVDESDPQLAPLDGVSLEEYVDRIGRRLSGGGELDPADSANSQWSERVLSSQNVQTRYYQLVCEKLA